MDDKTLRYDFHEEAKAGRGRGGRPTQLEWTTVMLTMGSDGKSAPKDEFDRLSEVTDGFKDVQLSIFMNGVQVNARYMLDRLYESFDRQVEDAVLEKLQEVGFDSIHDELLRVEREVVDRLRERLGLEPRDEEDY